MTASTCPEVQAAAAASRASLTALKVSAVVGGAATAAGAPGATDGAASRPTPTRAVRMTSSF